MLTENCAVVSQTAFQKTAVYVYFHVFVSSVNFCCNWEIDRQLLWLVRRKCIVQNQESLCSMVDVWSMAELKDSWQVLGFHLRHDSAWLICQWQLSVNAITDSCLALILRTTHCIIWSYSSDWSEAGEELRLTKSPLASRILIIDQMEPVITL